MKWSGIKIVLMAMLVAGILSGFCGQGRSQGSTAVNSDHRKSDSLALMTLGEIDRFVASNYGRLAIDTTGPEPEISITIKTDGRFYQLDSMGIYTARTDGDGNGDFVHVWVPIRLLPDIRSLESVIGIRYSGRIITHDIRRDRKYIPGTGIISGVVESFLPCVYDDAEFLLFPNVFDKFKEIDTVYANACIKKFSVTSTGVFRLTNLPKGLYHGIIVFNCVDSGNTSNGTAIHAWTSNVVIDSIQVRDGFISLIYFENLSLRPEGRRHYYVWLERFLEFD